jgi:putative transposase
MSDATRSREPSPQKIFESTGPLALDDIVRVGAQRMLQAAIEAEVASFIETHLDRRDPTGRRRVVRNGYLPSRDVLTGAGPLRVKQPRVRDRAGNNDEEIRFAPTVLPRYLRRSKSLDELIPWLYLKGISTGDFGEALQALLGADAKGLSSDVVTRLSRKWMKEYAEWDQRSLSEHEYAYLWVDGIHFNIRLEEDRQCILVVIGATKDGKKELVAVQDGLRESEQSWREILVDLKARGMNAPKLAVGDGALGFWAALRKELPTTREQRCWVHKTANVLNCLPKRLHGRAKNDLHQIWMAETRAQADSAFDLFLEKYGAKYPKARRCLVKDRAVLLTFYDFPAEHWIHLRTTNPIESTFATVRLRHRRTKGNGSREACLAMVFKLAQAAERRWRRLNTPALAAEVLQGTLFVDGIMQSRIAA